MLNFGLSKEEESKITSELNATVETLQSASCQFDKFLSLLENEYIAISAEHQKTLSKEIERLASLSWRVNVHRVKLKDSGRILSEATLKDGPVAQPSLF
jgi:post-segregation antitoxin (ccd killing protein)